MFYKYRRKQISAVILKPNIEVTSSTRYLYEHFLSFDSSDRANIYARIYDFSYVRKFCEQALLCSIELGSIKCNLETAKIGILPWENMSTKIAKLPK